MAACALNPHRDETAIARQMRAARPASYPNRLIVDLADRALGRNGRMGPRARRHGPRQHDDREPGVPHRDRMMHASAPP